MTLWMSINFPWIFNLLDVICQRFTSTFQTVVGPAHQCGFSGSVLVLEVMSFHLLATPALPPEPTTVHCALFRRRSVLMFCIPVSSNACPSLLDSQPYMSVVLLATMLRSGMGSVGHREVVSLIRVARLFMQEFRGIIIIFKVRGIVIIFKIRSIFFNLSL